MLLVILLGYYIIMGIGLYNLSMRNQAKNDNPLLDQYAGLVKAVIIIMSVFWPASVSYTFLKNAIVPSKK